MVWDPVVEQQVLKCWGCEHSGLNGYECTHMQAVEEAEHLRAELRRESLLRKRAHNELRELKGNIRVLCRVRPALAGVVNARRLTGGTSEIAIRPHDEFTVLLDTVSKCAPS